MKARKIRIDPPSVKQAPMRVCHALPDWLEGSVFPCWTLNLGESGVQRQELSQKLGRGLDQGLGQRLGQ